MLARGGQVHAGVAAGGEILRARIPDDGVEAVRLALELQPDIVLLDIALPKMSGLEVLAELRRRCPRTKTIIFTMTDDEHSVIRAFCNGARAYVLKSPCSTELLAALRIVGGGGSYMCSRVSEHVMAGIRRGELEIARPGSGRGPAWKEER